MLKASQTLSTSYLIKQLPTCTLFIDNKFKIVHASNKFISTFNLEGITISDKTLFQLFPKLNRKWKNVLQDTFKGKSNPMGIQKAVDIHKNERWHQWGSVPWYDGDEDIIGAIIQLDDVTEGVKAEIELQKTEVLFSQQSEIAKIGRWEYDKVNNTLKWCSMTKKIHEAGTDFEPNIETAIDFYKEGHSRNIISMALFEATDKGTPWSLKAQIITAKGNEKWILASGKPIFEKGKLTGLLGTIQDISEQVAADSETQKNEKLLRTLVDNLPLNVYVKDTQSRKILVNKSEYEYFGTTSDKELIGKDNYDLFDEHTARKYTDQDIAVMTSLQPILAEEVSSITKAGHETIFLTSKIPLINDQGSAFGLLGISMDITSLKQKEKELRNLIDVTSLQNKKLIDFAHIISHNLRSHTANFSMLLSFLTNEDDEKEKERILKMLTEASDSLMETLDNLNEVVAISTNVNAEKKPILLHKKIIAIQRNLSALLLNNQAEIINEVSEDTIIKVVPGYLESILMNFLTNSIKYKHPERNPVIRLSTKRKGKYTILSIEDNGLGIDLNKYGDKIFGMYKTFHTHKDSRGIGLYITKNQIEAMNGKVHVESKVNKGTIFKVYFNEES
ncbi:PAS domain S-box protein [Maribacter sp. 2210JD10-5]|uniref:PAS domain-containing sensor histidine kinase n=1 Tax=Maribacter sp. 2210JD10-5 TaxID=3386272 RepID=UPI0039BD3C01